MERLWIVVAGNPAAGFDHFGPFNDVNVANDWADEYIDRSLDWWVLDLNQAEPNDDD